MAERFLIKAIDFPVDSVPLPESVQVAQDHYAKLSEQKKTRLAELQKEKEERKKKLRAKAFEYQAEYAEERRDKLATLRQAKLTNTFFREPEAKVIFAVRIRGIRKLAPKPKKTLQLLRLRQIFNGVFIRVNKASLSMLHIVQPFVAYGTLTVGRVRKLMYKRGYCKVGRMGSQSRIRIQDNDIVSENMGKYGIHGIEDLIHEIYTCGPNFREANAFMWPFKLRPPVNGFTNKLHGFNEARGGDWGNREELMNHLIDKMI